MLSASDTALPPFPAQFEARRSFDREVMIHSQPTTRVPTSQVLTLLPLAGHGRERRGIAG
jgi:hypothetical protein